MSRPEPNELGGPGAMAGRDGARAASAREHAYRSLLQMGSETTLALGLHDAVDLLLFNLMGQLRTPRSGLWLFSEAADRRSVLIRAHGFASGPVRHAGAALHAAILARFTADGQPALAIEWAARLSEYEREALRAAGIAVIAPVGARETLLGWLALGAKLGGAPYTDEDMQILGATLGFAGASIRNACLHNQVLDANRHLHAMNAKLQETDRLKTEFMSNVNHELRTPLAIVIGALECLGGAGIVDRGSQQMLVGARENALHLKKLLEKLLAFSEIRVDRLPFDPVDADVRDMLEGITASRSPGISAGLRELRCELPAALPLAHCDVERLVQLLDELIDNAVKFTPQGSTIRLGATTVRTEDDVWVRIDVADNGPGIRQDQLAHIFSSFEQGDGSSTRRVGGLGMGLAFARDLAERMGGRLDVASAPGEGTTFSLTLRAA